MRVCELFGFTYEEFSKMPYKEKLRYLYYVTLKAMKEEHEVKKNAPKGGNANVIGKL